MANLDQAVALHNSGNFQDAEKMYLIEKNDLLFSINTVGKEVSVIEGCI